MSRDAVIAGIDVGSSKVCALIGEVQREARVHAVGVGVAPSRGIRRGVVVNIEEAVESITAAVEKAERVSGLKLSSAFVTVAGGHISAQNNRGVVAVSHTDRMIREDDVQRVLEAARVIALPSDRQILHVLPRAFTVDGQDGVHNPAGMVGYRLDVETHIVTCGATATQNLAQCLSKAGVDAEGMVLEPLASASTVLSAEEKEMGVALVDIGGGTTNLAIFTEGSVCHTRVLGVGGGHVTNDIAVGLRTPLGSAEEIKLAHGHALAEATAEDEMIRVSTFGGGGEEVSRQQLCEIIEARLEEMCAMVGAEIAAAGYGGLLPAGVVLTGGVAETPGIEELARRVLQVPVRVGRPRGITGLGEIVRGPAYTAVVGLLLWGARTEKGAYTAVSPRSGRPKQRATAEHAPMGQAYGRLMTWLRSFLP
ncbi:MAG: cell division protein FtsA [Dehalococcoidales bacterium]|nr:cell division protein FtsA [Dehalococcoidales bacterium]